MIERAMRETVQDQQNEQSVVKQVLERLPGLGWAKQGPYSPFDGYLFRESNNLIVAKAEIKVKHEPFSKADYVPIDYTKFVALWNGERPPFIPGLYIVAYRDPVIEQPDTIIYLDVNMVPAPVWNRLGLRRCGRKDRGLMTDQRPAFVMHKSRFTDFVMFPPKLTTLDYPE